MERRRASPDAMCGDTVEGSGHAGKGGRRGRCRKGGVLGKNAERWFRHGQGGNGTTPLNSRTVIPAELGISFRLGRPIQMEGCAKILVIKTWKFGLNPKLSNAPIRVG